MLWLEGMMTLVPLGDKTRDLGIKFKSSDRSLGTSLTVSLPHSSFYMKAETSFGSSIWRVWQRALSI